MQAIAGSPSKELDQFRDNLRSSLPRCFASSVLDQMAVNLATAAVRFRPIQISFGPGDPHRWKLICMPRDRLAAEGPIVMDPPVLLLVVEGNCVTRVTE